jgi:hypothetical protein
MVWLEVLLKLILIYLGGAVLIGFPLALTSLRIYFLAESGKLDTHRWAWLLKLVRAIIHPFAFTSSLYGGVWETSVEEARIERTKQQGKEDEGKLKWEEYYLFFSTLWWPTRIIFIIPLGIAYSILVILSVNINRLVRVILKKAAGWATAR